MHQYVRQVGAVDGGQHFSCNETLYLFESKFHSLMKLDYRRCIQNRQMDRGRMTDEQKLRYMMEWTDELVNLQHFEDVSDPNHVPAPLGLNMSIMGSASKDRKKREKDKEKEKKDEKKPKDKPNPTIASFATQAQPDETVLQTSHKQNFKKRNDRKKDDKGQYKKGAGDGKGDTKKPQSGASGSAHADEQKNRSEDDKGSTCLFCDSKDHPIHLCTSTKIKPATALMKAFRAGICLNCLRRGHAHTSCPLPACGLDGCKEKHNKRFHTKKKED